MQGCVFCQIVEGSIPSTKVYEDELCLAFLDINPQAPKHIVLIPKQHMKNFLECTQMGGDLIAHLMRAAADIANAQGLADKGFRLITNCGEHAAQSVQHFHIHLLGGAQLSTTMG
jgi:histidine triad (HIT) family protein